MKNGEGNQPSQQPFAGHTAPPFMATIDGLRTASEERYSWRSPKKLLPM